MAARAASSCCSTCPPPLENLICSSYILVAATVYYGSWLTAARREVKPEQWIWPKPLALAAACVSKGSCSYSGCGGKSIDAPSAAVMAKSSYEEEMAEMVGDVGFWRREMKELELDFAGEDGGCELVRLWRGGVEGGTEPNEAYLMDSPQQVANCG